MDHLERRYCYSKRGWSLSLMPMLFKRSENVTDFLMMLFSTNNCSKAKGPEEKGTDLYMSCLVRLSLIA